jgi:hypothetical protein
MITVINTPPAVVNDSTGQVAFVLPTRPGQPPQVIVTEIVAEIDPVADPVLCHTFKWPQEEIEQFLAEQRKP